MDCCKDDKNKGEGTSHKHGHGSHLWMMVLCCGIPMLLVLLLSVVGGSFFGLRNLFQYIIPFICPIAMGFMMFSMFKKEKSKDAEHKEEN